MWTCVRSTMFKPRWSNNLPLVCLPTDPGFYQRLIWRTRVKARVLHYSKVTTTCRRNQLHSVLAITIHLSLRDLGSGWSRLICPLDSQLGFWLEDPRQAARSTKPPVLDRSRFIGQPAFRKTVISEPCDVLLFWKTGKQAASKQNVGPTGPGWFSWVIPPYFLQGQLSWPSGRAPCLSFSRPRHHMFRLSEFPLGMSEKTKYGEASCGGLKPISPWLRIRSPLPAGSVRPY